MDPRLWKPLVAVLLSLASILSAGCVEDAATQDPASGEENPPSSGERPGAAAPDLRRVGFPVTRSNETHWWNGTFQGHENHNVVGDITEEVGIDAGAYHRRDVSDLIPRNMLVQVVIEVEAELAQGDLDTWLEIPPTSQSTLEADVPYGGWSRVEYTLVSVDDAPFELLVRHDEMEPTAFEYTLSMQVTAVTERLPDGFAAGVTLGEDDVLEIAADDTDRPVAVWGPDGSFLGRTAMSDGSARIDAAAAQGAGTYVLLREAGEGGAGLHMTGSTEIDVTFPALRWEVGEVHTADGPVTWSWTADTAPVVMGLAFRIPSTQSGDVKASVEGPDGGLLALDTEVTLTIGYNRMLSTPIGAEGLLPGEYSFEVTPGQMAPTGPMEAKRITAFLDHPSWR